MNGLNHEFNPSKEEKQSKPCSNSMILLFVRLFKFVTARMWLPVCKPTHDVGWNWKHNDLEGQGEVGGTKRSEKMLDLHEPLDLQCSRQKTVNSFLIWGLSHPAVVDNICVLKNCVSGPASFCYTVIKNYLILNGTKSHGHAFGFYDNTWTGTSQQILF